MGILLYDHLEYEFEDRALAHLLVLASTKLRRGEAFTLSWERPADMGAGRHSLWIANGVPIHFFFSGNRLASINREWIEEMLLASYSPAGVLLQTEPAATTRSP